MAHKGRNQKLDNSNPGQYITQNLSHLVPLPTVEGKLQVFLPFLTGIQLKITAGFLDSSECLRMYRLLHNTLLS